MMVARRLMMELYAAYYPSMYFKNLENMTKLPEFDQIEVPVCLDEVKIRLVKHGFSTLMSFLQKLKRLLDQNKQLKKGTPVHKYLKELEEVFEQFLLDHMSDYWQHLDGESSS